MAENGKKTIDERLDALTMNLELLLHQSEANHEKIEAQERRLDKLMTAIEKLVAVTNEDATAIRTLARLEDASRKQ